MKQKAMLHSIDIIMNDFINGNLDDFRLAIQGMDTFTFAKFLVMIRIDYGQDIVNDILSHLWKFAE